MVRARPTLCAPCGWRTHQTIIAVECCWDVGCWTTKVSQTTYVSPRIETCRRCFWFRPGGHFFEAFADKPMSKLTATASRSGAAASAASARLLPTRHHRPHRRAANSCDELASPHGHPPESSRLAHSQGSHRRQPARERKTIRSRDIQMDNSRDC
jgi:hypothetical protein